MLFKEITILNQNFEIEHDMYVGTKDDRIIYIGKDTPMEDFGEIYSGKNRLLIPGFYNAHAHSPMALMRGYGENLALMDWLNTRIFPFEDRLNSNAVYWGTLLCMAESLRYGIISSSDMYYFIPDMVKAVADSGAKANISRAVANPMGMDITKLPSMTEARDAITQFNGIENGRIIIDASIHAEYTSNEETVRCVADLAKEMDVRMHVHLSETKSEHEECKARHGGMSPAQYFNQCGIFDVPAIAAHCVWCEGEDFNILKEKGVTVASNPVSNLKLASGICNVTEMLKREIPVALGTDSVASNNNLSFFEEMKTFAILAKVREQNPTVITPKQALEAATINGALAQGRYDCGTIKEGNKADLLVLRTDTANMHPVHNMLNNIVYSATDGDIVMTMADGKVLYKDGEYTTIDIEKTIFETEAATAAILKQL
ncbi:amidohydrolase [Anaerotruncus sp. 80]|uniref:Amidohydrolase n=1 Tax=Anaerotruncus colihominis TaxID=169435 RepID=A0A845QME3_9FIRM|nr:MULTISPECIES: amidohydrolase [Anaerotruncus]NBH62796.1 amidohydrolase [Anaerotruncus colihominis]NCF03450.1 amidohydrolase [Anaerotruncus sp. 80]